MIRRPPHYAYIYIYIIYFYKFKKRLKIGYSVTHEFAGMNTLKACKNIISEGYVVGRVTHQTPQLCRYSVHSACSLCWKRIVLEVLQANTDFIIYCIRRNLSRLSNFQRATLTVHISGNGFHTHPFHLSLFIRYRPLRDIKS